jgi:GNAT superfamily N-acetyltransferase
MQIRFFQPDDTEALVGLLHDMSRHYNGENASPREAVRTNLVNNILGKDCDVRIVVACTGERVVGVAMISILYPAPKERAQLFMKELYVASGVRSQGVGKQIMAWIARYAVTTNCARFDWTVDAENTRALDFYRSIGATQVKDKLYFRFSGPELHEFAAGRYEE